MTFFYIKMFSILVFYIYIVFFLVNISSNIFDPKYTVKLENYMIIYIYLGQL